MLKITNIAPQYRIDKDNNTSVRSYLVDFKIKRDDLQIYGTIDFTGDISDLSAIQGKILYELKNILEP